MKCILCKHDLQIFSESSFFGSFVYKCDTCNFFINDETEESMKKRLVSLYKKNYWDKAEHDSILSGYKDTDSQGKRRNWVSQYAYTESMINGKKILEIGVGTGQTIFWFEQEGFDVEGIEPDGESVRLVNSILKKGRVTESTIEDFNTKKTYDVIWMSHVLEHIINPINFLKKIQENLKTNGIFFIEVPNCENSKMRNVSIQKTPHVLHFTVKSLSKMVRLADYEIIKCDTFSPATKIEGLKQKIFKNSFEFYPRIQCASDKGKDLRIVLRKRK